MPPISLDEAIDSWLPREIRSIEDAYGSSVVVSVPERPARYPELLLDLADPTDVGPRAEAYLYEGSGDPAGVAFTVFLCAVVPPALPRRVHLWGVDLLWTAGVVKMMDAQPGRDPSPLETAALGPGIERLLKGDYDFRRRSNPFRRERGSPYGI